MDYTFHFNLAFEHDFSECQLASHVAGSGHMICSAINWYPAFMEFSAFDARDIAYHSGVL